MTELVVIWTDQGVYKKETLKVGQLWDVPAVSTCPTNRFLITNLSPLSCEGLMDSSNSNKRISNWMSGRTLAPIQPGDVRVTDKGAVWKFTKCFWSATFSEWWWKCVDATDNTPSNVCEATALKLSKLVDSPKPVTRKGNYTCACGSQALQLFATIECFNEKCSHYIKG